MKILIDINHPAHVHYFKNFIKIMEQKGHCFIITNRDDKMINELLDLYCIPHFIRNKRPKKNNKIKALATLIQLILFIWLKALKEKPDLYMGFGSFGASFVGWLFRKPSILLDDTDFNHLNHKLYKSFCSTVLTPFYFNVELGDKQLRFNAFIEQLYLHSKYFRPNFDSIKEIGLTPQEYVVVRYIAYDAYHDNKATMPLSLECKKNIIKLLSTKYKVVLSAESYKVDDFFKPYLAKFSPDKMHDVEAGAKFIVTEGQTMASECFMLGVPFINIDPLRVGYVQWQINKFPKYYAQSIDEKYVMQRIKYLMDLDDMDINLQSQIEKEFMCPTDFLVWFVENYPDSEIQWRENRTEIEKRFK